MSTLTDADIHKIAHLARLALAPHEIPEYAQNLSKILGFVEQMNAVETADITPMAHPLDAVARVRDDVVTETDQREHFQHIAPHTEAGLYLVPEVIETE